VALSPLPAGFRPLTIDAGIRAAANRTPGKMALREGARHLSYAALVERTDRVAAAAVADLRLEPGATAALLTHNCLEFIEIIAGLAGAGIAVATPSPRLSMPEIGYILQDCGARAVFVAPALAEAVRDLVAPGTRVIEIGPEYEAWLARSQARRPEVAVAEWDTFSIPYTSGTTGKPKGIVRDNGGHAVAMAWSMLNIYDTHAGQVWWTASDVGWVVGHSYIVYAPLINGSTTVLYEGKPVGTPDAGAFWRVIEEHHVEALFTAPTAIRAIKKEDPEGKLLAGYDLSRFKRLFLAGERLDPETYRWATERLGVPVVDNWWQTETGWPIAANLRGLAPMEIKPGSPTVPVPGYRVHILGEQGTPVGANEEGAICLKLPLPPGTLTTLWRDDERYVSSYLSAFEGYYLSGDGGYLDEDGYLFVMGRTDDVINVAGHRLSTGSMEAVIATHPAVAECAVIGVADPMKGQVPRGFVVLKSGVEQDPDELGRELVARVREEIGAVAALREITVVGGLPKTRSGKILRKTMREIADGKDAKVPSTIEDTEVLDTLRPALRHE
jgi:propionyl-CoA synthetase